VGHLGVGQTGTGQTGELGKKSDNKTSKKKNDPA